MTVKSDIEIAREAKMKPITEVAAKLERAITMLDAHPRLLAHMPTNQLPLPGRVAERELPVLRFGPAFGAGDDHRFAPAA